MNFYLNRFGIYPPLLQEKISTDLFLSVVIPCYNEPDLLRCLKSLKNCTPTLRSVEVIIVVNHPQSAPNEIVQQNVNTYHEAVNFSLNTNSEGLKFLPLIMAFPDKDAGVGLARKAGMDEAVRRFESSGIKNGIIVCLDADCFVSENYLFEIENYFLTHDKCNAASIYFEHPLNSVSGLNRESIIEYELFLRVYVHGLKRAGLPFAYHTVGSSMAVRHEVYQKQGGMNKRKAGEDFYFLQKVFLLGNFGEIKTCKVFPSCRSSTRVPFGTGRAVGDALGGKKILFYDDKVFEQIKWFVEFVVSMGSKGSFKQFMDSFKGPIIDFLNTVNWEEKRIEILTHVSSEDQFRKRFFAWFDGFMVLKCVHFLSDKYFPRKEFSTWIRVSEKDPIFNKSPEALLCELRKSDSVL